MAERDCGKVHNSIEEAIQHARTNLGGADIDPVWGTMRTVNMGRVVGYQSNPRKRWRLDFDPHPDKGVHVNEENFELPAGKVIHKVTGPANDMQVRLYWNKWTTRYGKPGLGIYCNRCQAWHPEGHCPIEKTDHWFR